MQIVKTTWGYNGCGPSFISDYVPNFDFTDVCNAHDIATFYGGSPIQYLSVNLGFYVDLLKVISSKDRRWYEPTLLFFYATFLGTYTFLFNWLFYNWTLKK